MSKIPERFLPMELKSESKTKSKTRAKSKVLKKTASQPMLPQSVTRFPQIPIRSTGLSYAFSQPILNPVQTNSKDYDVLDSIISPSKQDKHENKHQAKGKHFEYIQVGCLQGQSVFTLSFARESKLVQFPATSTSTPPQSKMIEMMASPKVV